MLFCTVTAHCECNTCREANLQEDKIRRGKHIREIKKSKDKLQLKKMVCWKNQSNHLSTR